MQRRPPRVGGLGADDAADFGTGDVAQEKRCALHQLANATQRYLFAVFGHGPNQTALHNYATLTPHWYKTSGSPPLKLHI
jgi:hypothetical protein